MKKLIVFFLAMVVSAGIMAQDKEAFVVDENKQEVKAIERLIQEAYVDGLQNNGDLAKTKQGFHPGFNLLINENGVMNKFPIYNWIHYAQMKKKKDGAKKTGKDATTVNFDMIDITGNAAIAKISLFKGGEKIFVDYLSLYKFGADWKIVAKIYHKVEKEKTKEGK